METALPVSMQEPVCLISNGEDGSLSVSSETLKILQQIQQPVVVVAIVGVYRTGKSFLMNQLAGKSTGFPLGNTIESKTKGIWMWCVPHPTKEGHTLVLLDTEGFQDVEKGDTKHDIKLFVLAILLSSTLVYNSRATIGNRTIEDLHYVTELTEHIKINANEEEGNSVQFVNFFPNFICAVRDFTLEKKINGKKVTDDEYLDHALQLKTGTSGKIASYNLPRECIRNYFPSRKCFTFPFPTNPDNMSNLEKMNKSDLLPTFVRVAEQFCQFVYEKSHAKVLKDGFKVNGKVLGELVMLYVDIISSGGMPCLENAVVAISLLENEAAVKNGVGVYRSGMEELKQTFPVQLTRITSEHQRLYIHALQEFMKRRFKDDQGEHLKSLEKQIENDFEQYLLHNEGTSKKECRDLLTSLSAEMTNRVQSRFYMKPGGYKLLEKDMEIIESEYTKQTTNSVKATEIMEEFIKNNWVQSESIRQADSMLSEKEIEISEERQKTRLLEQKVKAEEEEKQRLKAQLGAAIENLENKIKLMEENNVKNMKQREEEFDKVLQIKMREQEEMLKKGYAKQAEMLMLEIEEVKRSHAAYQAMQDKKFELMMEKCQMDRQEYQQAMSQINKHHEQTIALLNQQHEMIMAQINGSSDKRSCSIQ
ncbi:guanylate-binding protein 1-like [Sardina pilchardus]|uniref:guanylate-binding protein 1-like n=1 Tax=Sardina pilchardus TaxID=27697 RepID=UPI002E0EECC1